MRVLKEHGTHAAVDRRRLFQALAFNFVIAGTDAHAKNFSLLLSHRGARLAPLYDLASYLPYVAGQMPIRGKLPSSRDHAAALGA